MMEPESVAIPEKLINVEGLFASKNPALLRLMPRFLLNYIKNVIHEDEVNSYIYRHREKFGLPFVVAILREFGVNVVTRIHHHPQLDPMPLLREMLKDRRVILASNHPLGGLDGLALMSQVGEVRPDLVFPVNDLLMNLPGLKPLFIPINKHGRNTENARIIEDTFAGGKAILYFPAGLVSRKFRGGVIRDLEWKPTFIKKARKYQRDVLPVFISGRNTDRFYNIANWRKRFGIKANLEMFFLVDEMMRQKGQTITLEIGSIIPWQSFDRTRPDTEWAAFVRDTVYKMNQHNI
jgi:hypothetical protein